MADRLVLGRQCRASPPVRACRRRQSLLALLSPESYSGSCPLEAVTLLREVDLRIRDHAYMISPPRASCHAIGVEHGSSRDRVCGKEAGGFHSSWGATAHQPFIVAERGQATVGRRTLKLEFERGGDCSTLFALYPGPCHANGEDGGFTRPPYVARSCAAGSLSWTGAGTISRPRADRQQLVVRREGVTEAAQQGRHRLIRYRRGTSRSGSRGIESASAKYDVFGSKPIRLLRSSSDPGGGATGLDNALSRPGLAADRQWTATQSLPFTRPPCFRHCLAISLAI